jgi:hypothetical protein
VRFAAFTSGAQGKTGLKFIVEILKLNGAEQPRVLYSFAHTASSVDMIRETMMGVLQSAQWPPAANGFRILSPDGVELCRWPELSTE